MIDIATKIRELRKIKGWSQEEFSDRLGISRSAVGNYEQGTREPDFETLENIADTLNCSISFLMGKDSDFYCSNEEKEIIRQYRVADKSTKNAACAVLGVRIPKEEMK